ncbi:pyrolysin [Collybia nuda]|uniref:Pyrolysin n=1 Tax=Collybia nuda TaxID=64659 RepID=A0A9P5YEX1_9AGAR|nr:pyrolysin [Collybia nuda]
MTYSALRMERHDSVILQDTPGVKSIRPVRKFQRPKMLDLHILADTKSSPILPDPQAIHIITGVSKLHAEGIAGKGIKIGVIDTGIDYTHPTLGGGFGPSFKVIGGFDFVGDTYDGTTTPLPDDDPLDQCYGHGTHVAGIIGANPVNAYNISGVAYEASLSAYRIFGCLGFTTDDIILEALLRAVDDSQDILTLSLGEVDGWTESSSSVVASRIAASGKVVTVAAGNDGASGSWYSSSPGNGINVISVSSLDSPIFPLQNATVSGVAHDPITYFQTFPFPLNNTWPIYATSNDTMAVDDACKPLPSSTPDLSPFVVVVRRGTCTYTQQIENISAKGAKTALIYDNGDGFTFLTVGNYSAAVIQAADGEFLVSQFVGGVPITLSFPQSGASTEFPNPAGGLISSFTSYGPSNDFYFKPAVTAPGGLIMSTLPVTKGYFGAASGTSMATPFVAGCAALLFSVQGNSPEVGKAARTLFETNAHVVASSHVDGDPLQTVTQQGAGLIDIYDAIYAKTIVTPAELILNDTAHFERQQTFTVKNTGNTAKKYLVSHVPAGTAITVTPGTISPAAGPVPLSQDAASIVFSQNTFTVDPGQSQTITASFVLPKVEVSAYPIFSGFIQVSSGTEKLHVSYLGLAASLKNKHIIDNTDTFFGVQLPAVLDSTGNVQTSPVNYTFAGNDFPTLLFRLVFGTPALRVDLVDVNFQPEASLASRVEPKFTFPKAHQGGSFAQVQTVGSLLELEFISRNNENPDDNGYTSYPFEVLAFANGTLVPNGSYKFFMRALRVTGDPDQNADYESWLSPAIGVAA